MPLTLCTACAMEHHTDWTCEQARLFEKARVENGHQLAKLSCQLCGVRWYQFTRKDGTDCMPDLDATYADFRAHVSVCSPEYPLMNPGFN